MPQLNGFEGNFSSFRIDVGNLHPGKMSRNVRAVVRESVCRECPDRRVQSQRYEWIGTWPIAPLSSLTRKSRDLAEDNARATRTAVVCETNHTC